MANQSFELLETFPNPNIERDYTISFEIPEFSCLCPKTGQPDFAILKIDYIPDNLCVELKSLKLYICSYRNHGAFHEAVTNQICNDITNVINPNYLKVKAKFNIRGGIYTTIECFKTVNNWQDINNLV